MLCRQARTCKSDDTTSHDGCNGLKGKLYDRLFRNLFDEQGHHPTEFTHRHGVGILVMAYLGAFQTFGYEYILQQQLAEIREQFDYPDQRKTDWLDSAQFWLPQVQGMVIATDSGHPFVFGLSGRNLEVIFRRCRALLPGGFWVKEPVASLTNLIRSVRTDAAR